MSRRIAGSALSGADALSVGSAWKGGWGGAEQVVGERTFGKGVVQTVTPLYYGSAVAVTVARLL